MGRRYSALSPLPDNVQLAPFLQWSGFHLVFVVLGGFFAIEIIHILNKHKRSRTTRGHHDFIVSKCLVTTPAVRARKRLLRLSRIPVESNFLSFLSSSSKLSAVIYERNMQNFGVANKQQQYDEAAI